MNKYLVNIDVVKSKQTGKLVLITLLYFFFTWEFNNVTFEHFFLFLFIWRVRIEII